MTERENPHIGSTLDDFLEEEGTLEQNRASAIKEVIAYQIQQEMERGNITKTEMAQRLNTSRSQLNRLLDPKATGVSLDVLQRAAAALGRDLRIELV